MSGIPQNVVRSRRLRVTTRQQSDLPSSFPQLHPDFIFVDNTVWERSEVGCQLNTIGSQVEAIAARLARLDVADAIADALVILGAVGRRYLAPYLSGYVSRFHRNKGGIYGTPEILSPLPHGH